MKHECPSCTAGYTLNETYYRGGRPFLCGKCNKTTTVPLYCPTCYPPGVEVKGLLQTPAGHLGGETYRCPRNHTFTVPIAHGEALGHMGELGSQIGLYNQSERIAQLADSTLKNKVSGGYCAGAVYDWIRRALHGGKVTFDDVSARQDRRAAIAWERRGDRFQLDTAKELADIEAVRKAGSDKRKAFVDVVRGRLEEVKSRGIPEEKYASLVEQAKVKLREMFAEDVASDERKVGLIQDNARANAFWQQFSAKMDAVIEQDRVARRRPAGTGKRKFGNLTVAHSIQEKEFSGGIAALIEAVIRDPAMEPNFAAFVSIVPPVQDSIGHAVGVLRQNTGDRYVLFDPNFGMWEFTAARLKEAMIYLFTRAYPHSLGAVGSDSQAYEIGGRVRGDYTIFENSGPSAQAVAPSLPIGSGAARAAEPMQLRPLQS